MSPKQRQVLRLAKENPTIILDAISETRKGIELRGIQLPEEYLRSQCVELAMLADHERQFKLWIRGKNDPTFTDEQVIKLFVASKFPNPAPIWNPKTQQYNVFWNEWKNEVDKFFRK